MINCISPFFLVLLAFTFVHPASGVIRDGGIDPANLGKGEWIYSVKDATNRLGGHIDSVTNEASLFQYYKSIGVKYVIIKMGTSAAYYEGCYATPHQVTATLCDIARTNGVWVFGYTRSYGEDIAGEVALVDSVFNNGADGFVFDAEAEWESNQPWIGTNGPALAWELGQMVRAKWPTKFIAHAPFPVLYLHSSFPYKEFGYWCDTIMPQVYHISRTGLKGSPSAVMNWMDVNYRTWQNSLIGTSSVINGQTIYWTNSIKPIAPVQDVYGEPGDAVGRCNGTTVAYADRDVMEFIDYAAADPNTATVGGYKGVNFWRADLHGVAQFARIAAGTSGNFPGVVNNIVMDDAHATQVGTWTHVLVFSSTVKTPTYHGVTETDINPFGTNYWTKTKGTGSDYMQYRPEILTAGEYDVYQWHVFRADAATNVPFVINHALGTSTVFANQQTNAGNWSWLGRFSFDSGTNATIRVLDSFSDPASVAVVDGLKLVYAPPLAIPAAPSGLTATGVNAVQIDLVWTDNSTNETGFIMGRSTTSGGPYTHVVTLNENVTTYSDTTLSYNTTYYYVVRALNSVGESANSSPAGGTTLNTPTITTQPSSRTNHVGSIATFSVVASGAPPLAYQWRKNESSLSNGGNISGATDATLTSSDVSSLDAGNYSVRITNSFGSVTSVVATLTVNVATPPSITTHPSTLTVVAGENASFNVVADGSAPLHYQWKFNGEIIPNATGSTFTRSNAQPSHAGSYSVVVTNAAGSDESDATTLTINYSLIASATVGGSVAKSPDQSSYASNSFVTLTATANAGFSFTGWSGDASGSTHPLNVTMTTNKTITANFATSTNDLILDNDNPAVTFFGDWQTGTGAGKFGANYRFAITTNGGHTNVIFRPNISTPGFYSVLIWYTQGSNRSTNAPWTIVHAAGSETILVNQQINGGNWFQIASARPFLAGTNGYVQLSISNAGPIVVMADAVRFLYSGAIPPPSIDAHPEHQSVRVGTDVTFNVSATSSTPLGYQWRFGGIGIPSATQSSYTRANVQTNDAGAYSVLVGNAGGFVASSNAMLNVILPAPPVFHSVTRLPDGRFDMLLSGHTGVSYWIDRTTNLVDWEPLTNLFNANGTVEFIDSPATNSGKGFYRARE